MKKRRRRENRSSSPYIPLLKSFAAALGMAVLLVMLAGFIMINFSLSDSVVSTAGIMVLSFFVLSFSFLFSRWGKWKRIVCALVSTTISMVGFLLLKFSFSQSSVDANFWLKILCIVISGMIGFVLSAGSGKKRA